MPASRDRKKSFSCLFFMFLAFSFRALGADAASPDRNVILIGWDGAQREHVMELLDKGDLPNLKRLVQQGTLVFTEVTTGATETKPGWSEILTGYSSDRTGVLNNKNYRPIPKGYTLFERLEHHFGPRNIVTIFVGGKSNNIGSRGPHEICMNCLARDRLTRAKTKYWDRRLIETTETHDGRPPEWAWRSGEPYFYSRRTTDLYVTELGAAENVLKEVVAALEKFHQRPFFAFFHFEEPDEQGHVFGENSFEYSEALRTADRCLGVILQTLERLGIAEKTTVFVTSDHGMDEGGDEHMYAPLMFCATNSKKKMRDGDRKDIAPTILEEYGIDPGSFPPPLDGKSLFVADNAGPQEKK